MDTVSDPGALLALAPFLIPYLAVSLVLAVAWALACVLYGSIRSDRSATMTFVLGLGVMVLAPIVVVGLVLLASP
jgi:hypothetical protein